MYVDVLNELNRECMGSEREIFCTRLGRLFLTTCCCIGNTFGRGPTALFARIRLTCDADDAVLWFFFVFVLRRNRSVALDDDESRDSVLWPATVFFIGHRSRVALCTIVEEEITNDDDDDAVTYQDWILHYRAVLVVLYSLPFVGDYKLICLRSTAVYPTHP